MTPRRVLFYRLCLVFLGVLLAALLLEAGMRCAGWAIERARVKRNNERLAEGEHLRVLCLGESTTLGDPLNLRYPDALEIILDAQLRDLRVSVINGGHYGILTHEILADLESNLDYFDPQIVVTMMGINDFGKTHAYGTVISPGEGRWYGSLRIYKLHRVLRVALERRFFGTADIDRMLVGEGITQLDRSNDMAGIANQPIESLHGGIDDETAEVFAAAEELRVAGRIDEAEALLREVLRRNPTMVGAYIHLSGLFTSSGEHQIAHEILLECAAVIPETSIDLQEALARSHESLGRWDQAIDILMELRRDLVAADVYRLHIHYARDLARVYEASGRLDLAEHHLIEIADRLSPGDDVFCQDLIDFYERNGRREDAAHRRQLQEQIRHHYVNPVTRSRYQELSAILEERGITHIAAQYPVRRIETLKRLLDDDSYPVYVDNSFFSELVERDGIEVYFTDLFGGDFGHMTSFAHELLAENIARAIIDGHFGREFDEDWRGPDGGPAAAFEAGLLDR